MHLACFMLTVDFCSSLEAPENGAVAYSPAGGPLYDVDTVATFTCNMGYMVTGDATRVCTSGTVWSGSSPTCQGI